MDTITITYRRRAAARAGTQRFWLATHIEALPDGDAVKQLVAFMALYARDILHGELPGPYSDDRALTFARLALVDPDTYAAHHADSDAHHADSDAQLADALGLPADQIPAVRRDQATAQAQASRRRGRSSQDCADPAPTHAQERSSRPIAADVATMKTIQIIELDGRPAALVAGDKAIIAHHITGADRARVQAKALYAIEIATGARSGPYTDQRAERYAASAATSCAGDGRGRRAGHQRRRQT
jgi:hypothetical protein